MRRFLAPILIALATAADAYAGEELIDRLGESLTLNSDDGRFAARLSGTLDLEGYSLPHPAPSLFYTRSSSLFVPRLSVFLDAQIGPWCYVFSQARVDRGFDPTDRGLEARLDEYALRLALRADGKLNLQAGRFATVVGRWIQRHGSWENPFVTAPLAYENLTAIWDSAAARTADVLIAWAHVRSQANRVDEYTDKHLRVPVVWGPSYATGVALSGQLGRFDYAIEAKNASLSSRPEEWESDREHWRHPSYAARLGWRPNVMWNLGVSGSLGHYLMPSAAATVAPGFGLDDYRQTVIGPDVSFAWRRWQVWAEVIQARFAVPRVGEVETVASFVETKLKLAPQFSLALRANRQTFSHLTDSRGRRTPWGRDLWRFDVAPCYRFTPHLQLKLQYSFQEEDGPVRRRSHIGAAQTALRF